MNDSGKRKIIADKLSVLFPLTSKKGRADAVEILKELGYKESSESAETINPDDSFPPGHIGIYKPETVNGEVIYNRDLDYIDRWTFFADVSTINKKKDKKRLVFLGESVARGFLLEPEYTPALVLNKLINANSGNDQFEVIDLAESNISMRAIKNRFIQSLDLEPDLVVFLAGNNWYIDYLDEINYNQETFDRISEALKKADNIGDIKPQLESVMQELVIGFLTFLSQKVKKHNIPIILVIPEFNLMDIRSTPGERTITYLSGDKMKKWAEARGKALSALEEQNQAQLEIHAQCMIDIDPSHPYGYELLADAKIRQQDYDAARELLELGRDTAIFCRSNSKPRTLKVTRKTILDHAGKMGIEVLDLPEVFKAHLSGKIPGKDLFLDYCHFTSKGIQVAMESLADQVLAITGNENKKLLQASRIRPSKLTVAMGYLFAAIHNEHWGQSYELHRHHCQKALEASNAVAKTMIYYCDMMSRNIPNNLTKSLEMIAVEDIQVDRYGSAFMHPKDFKLMEIELVDAMTDVLAKIGINLRNFIKELRKKEYGVEEKSRDLLNPAYSRTSYDVFMGVRTAFFQSRDTDSKFIIVADENVSVDLTISFRVPDSESVIGRVEFWYNGTNISSINAKSIWTTHQLIIPGKYSKEGINNLVVRWPLPKRVDKQTSSDDPASNSILNSSYYVFGEISHFKAAGVKDTFTQEESMVESASI